MNPELQNTHDDQTGFDQGYQPENNQAARQTGPMITGVPGMENRGEFIPPAIVQNPYIPDLDTSLPPQEGQYKQAVDNTSADTSHESLNQPASPQYESSEELIIHTWQAPDAIVGNKDKNWYIYFGIVVAVLVILSIMMRSWSFTFLIAVSAVSIILLRATSKVNQVTYSVSSKGFYIGSLLHEYHNFKSFGVLKENNIYSIIFIPRKRFSPSVSILFPQTEGEKIVDIVGAYLPMKEVKLDMIDEIVRKLRL